MDDQDELDRGVSSGRGIGGGFFVVWRLWHWLLVLYRLTLSHLA